MISWRKHPANPVLGPGYTTSAVFDCSIVPVEDRLLHMWFSWRDVRSLAYTESIDGVHWAPPFITLEYNPGIDWEKDSVNRPAVLRVGDTWYLWYTGQNDTRGTSEIGLATSQDGLVWKRIGKTPVLSPAGGWERKNVMCPHVLFEEGRFRMWYSGGQKYEPDAIGYAESLDGIHWSRVTSEPVIAPLGGWEASRTAAACVLRRERDYLAFYIGFGAGFEHSQIGMARSPDGIHGWQRYPGNPVIQPGTPGSWDDCNIYKPVIVRFQGQWLLYYNASRKSDHREQIGLVTAAEIDF